MHPSLSLSLSLSLWLCCSSRSFGNLAGRYWGNREEAQPPPQFFPGIQPLSYIFTEKWECPGEGRNQLPKREGRWVEGIAQEQMWGGQISVKAALLIPLGKLYEVEQRKTGSGNRRLWLEAWNLDLVVD